jgi:hypothetical protein
VRLLASLAASSLLLLAACTDEETSGKGAGAACASAGECREGLVCFERACAADYLASPSCATPGAPAIAPGAAVVLPEPPEGSCITDVREPAGAGFVLLGEIDVGTPTELFVPPGTASLTIFSQEVDAPEVPFITFQGASLPNTVVPTDVRLPDGDLFYSDLAPYPVDAAGYDDVTGVLAYYGGFTPIAGAFTLPNTAASLDLVRTAGEVPPGTWTFTVNDWALECLGIAGCTDGADTSRYRVHAFARPGPLASTGTLDLEIYLATNPSGELPTAAAAAAHPQIARFVRGLSSYLAGAGICLGAVTFRDLPAWARSRYAPAGVVDVTSSGTPPYGCDDLSQLFTVAMAPTRAVHLFLADELLDGASDLGVTLGIDGSIPGPSGIPGTITSGAIVGIGGFFGVELAPAACGAAAGPSFACGTDVLAYIAAHEAGHWLGLYHTTEWYGATFDPLSDTGTCACESCAAAGERAFCVERGSGEPAPVFADSCRAPDGGLVDVASRAIPAASCAGGQNLMFWQFDREVSQGRLSRQQGEVMRLNPAVR